MAAYGAVILKDGQRIWSQSQIFFPLKDREKETSNNVAEYNGFLAILLQLKGMSLQQEEIHIYGDSNLVIQQMSGSWRIKQGFYVPFALSARKLIVQFPRLSLHWIPREENHLADKLSKAELIKAGVKFRIQPEEKPRRTSKTGVEIRITDRSEGQGKAKGSWWSGSSEI